MKNTWVNYIGVKDNHCKISTNLNFVGLLINKEKTENNVLVWPINSKDGKNPLYAGFGSIELEVDSYSLEDIILRTRDGRDYIDIVYFDSFDIKNFKDMTLRGKTFEIKSLHLKFNPSQFYSLKTLILDSISFGDLFKTSSLNLVVAENYLTKKLVITLLVLTGFMIFLLVSVLMMYAKNRIMKEELERDIQENEITEV